MIVKYRSRLQALPYEVRRGLGEVVYQIGMTPASRKKRCIDVLKKYNIPFKDIGTGTNRFIIRYDGYAIKIALDLEGVADNKQEWCMSPKLAPHVAPAHEISKGGHLLVASYAPAFSSYNEFNQYRTQMADILKMWSNQYLLGDVGLTSINYANWGLLMGKPVCIDYAYIFPSSLGLFKCDCGCDDMVFTDETFTAYRCSDPKCPMVYTDRELRARISNEVRMRSFNNMLENSIPMTSPVLEQDVPDYMIHKEEDLDMPDPVDVIHEVNNRFGIPTGGL